MRRCWGITRNLRRCGRLGNWKLFCSDHRFQPIGCVFFIVFTVVAGTASIYSAWFQRKPVPVIVSPVKSSDRDIPSSPTPSTSPVAKGQSDQPKLPQPKPHQTDPSKLGDIPLGVSIARPSDPYIVVTNSTDRLVEGITWTLVMYRTSDQAFFSYSSQNIGYLKAHSTSPGYALELNRIAYKSGAPSVSMGEDYIGSIIVDCPTCRGTTLIVSFTWGETGWFYEMPNGDGRLFLPKDLASKEMISKYIEYVNSFIGPEKRTEIK